MLDIGGRIVEVLQVTSEPRILPSPQIIPDGTSLKIGPSLIGRRQEITINVLTEGGEPSLTCHSTLIDVQVRQRTEGPSQPRTVTLVTLVTLAVAIVATAVAGLRRRSCRRWRWWGWCC